MLDSISTSFKIESPSILNHREYKAPTDESIKLLNEFQEKALSNIIEHIIEHIKVDTNNVKGDVLLYDDYVTFDKKIVLKFNLNGKDFVFIDIVRQDFYFDVQVACTKLIERFSQVLVKELLSTPNNEFEQFIVSRKR